MVGVFRQLTLQINYFKESQLKDWAGEEFSKSKIILG
jgi:hypothetical protein